MMPRNIMVKLLLKTFLKIKYKMSKSEKHKYLVSVDIEGITGVSGSTFAKLDGVHYTLAMKYMLSDVNAVVQGIINVDQNATIVVRDAHGLGINIVLEGLHPKARLIQGWGDEMNMVESVDESYKGVFLVGYHAGGSNNKAVLAHTMSSLIHSVKINGELYNETGIAAACAGYYNVPVAFISGDNHTIKEAKEQLGDIVGVVVKESCARDCALSLSLSEAKELLIKGAEQAAQNLLNDKVMVLKIPSPIKTEIKFYNIGFGISVFQKLYKTLEFDKSYEFDAEHFAIRYSSNSHSLMLQRLNLILQLVYGMKK